MHRTPPIYRLTFCAVAVAALGACSQPEEPADPRDSDVFWGMGTGAEWRHEFPRFHPIVKEAGVDWSRGFAEWKTIQPEPGVWDWEFTDRLIESLRENDLRNVVSWAYFANFASADGGTRNGPIKDMQLWRDFVRATVERYHDDIKYWHVWNEFNGGFYSGEDRPQEYADLLVEAHAIAKEIDPTLQVGINTASTDVGFIHEVIQDGGAGKFDFISVHPYENLAALKYGDQMGYLTVVDSIREMLEANGEDPDTPIWITEIGAQTPVEPDAEADRYQAEILAKAYLLAAVQGFDRVLWFEIRGPTYGKDTDYGVLREDWTERPSLDAFRTMVKLLGPTPDYQGWLDLERDGHGFRFDGPEGPVVAAWVAPNREDGAVSFDQDVEVVSLLGEPRTLPAGETLSLGDEPVYLLGLPEGLLATAQANQDQPFPWDGDYADAEEIRIALGGEPQGEGIRKIYLRTDHEGRTEPATVNGTDALKVVSSDKDNNFAYFRANKDYVGLGDNELDITVVARRADSGQPAKMAITYETSEGYQDFKEGGESWEIPAGDGWQEHTWSVDGAYFANKWGWNLGLINQGEPGFLIKEVRIKKRD
ncbi:MAG: beta-galactosidase [Verrucomicrobiota bacterium]